jgi:alanyl-tRNA synthetase
VASGIRRIEGVTADYARDFIREEESRRIEEIRKKEESAKEREKEKQKKSSRESKKKERELKIRQGCQISRHRKTVFTFVEWFISNHNYF